MAALSRILFVDDTPAEWQVALSGLADGALMEQTTVVRDKDEALDFLHARGSFQRRVSGLPAVVVLGPNVRSPSAMSLLKDIRSDATLRRVPVVMIAAAPDEETVRHAYEQGVNSLIRTHEDVKIRAERYAALALFWAWANEPPPGSLSQTKAQRLGQ
jgi:two-component system response regulator